MGFISARRVREAVAVAGTFALAIACGGSATDTQPGGPQGSVSDAGVKPTPGADGGGADSGPPPVPQVDGAACPATPSQVVMIGDSYPAVNKSEIQTHLQSLAIAGGALAAGSTYRGYFIPGANMATYPGQYVADIPSQWATALAANPDIKYVIMDGGGNDILLENTNCITTSPPPGDQACVTAINNAVTAATGLFQKMKTAGVQKIIYYFYPHLPTTGRPYANATLDYAFSLVKGACDSAAVPCFFVDTRPPFEGHPELIGPDGIHPTAAGSDIIAGLIWDTMQNQCVAL